MCDGYSTEDWLITDGKGNAVDPSSSRWSEDDLVFTATKWTLVEASCVSIPADPSAGMRAADLMRFDCAFQSAPQNLQNIRARMQARQGMTMRTSDILAVAPISIQQRKPSIFNSPRSDVSEVKSIRARVQARHNIAFGFPTYADFYFDQ